MSARLFRVILPVSDIVSNPSCQTARNQRCFTRHTTRDAAWFGCRSDMVQVTDGSRNVGVSKLPRDNSVSTGSARSCAGVGMAGE